jgi:glycosyl transferase family 25
MKIFVISMKSAVKRRAQIAAQLGKLQLEFEWIDAVEGKSLSEAELRRLTNYEQVQKHRRWLSNGAIGCALSHLEAYERIADSNEDYALVLEDDALLQNGFKSFLDAYEEQVPPLDVTLLFFMSWKTCVLQAAGKIEAGPAGIYRPKDVGQPAATTGYIVKATACRQLLDKLRPVSLASDSWGDFHRLGAIESIGCVYPMMVVEDDLKSTIDYVHVRYARFFELVDKHRVFPLYQMLRFKRKVSRERMMDVRIV